MWHENVTASNVIKYRQQITYLWWRIVLTKSEPPVSWRNEVNN